MKIGVTAIKIGIPTYTADGELLTTEREYSIHERIKHSDSQDPTVTVISLKNPDLTAKLVMIIDDRENCVDITVDEYQFSDDLTELGYKITGIELGFLVSNTVTRQRGIHIKFKDGYE